MELYGSLFVSLIGDIPSLPVRARGAGRERWGPGAVGWCCPLPEHPSCLAGHPRLMPCCSHSVVESAGKMGKPPWLQRPAGQGRAAQPGALPALLCPSWTLSEALRGEKKSGEDLIVPLASSAACPVPIFAFFLSPL